MRCNNRILHHIRLEGWQPLPSILKKVQECKNQRPSVHVAQASACDMTVEDPLDLFSLKLVGFLQQAQSPDTNQSITDSRATHHFCNEFIDY